MRRKAAAKRKVLPDPKHGSELLSKFINHVMRHGKKAIAEGIVYEALEIAFDKVKHAKASDKKSHQEESESGEGNGSGSMTAAVSVLELLDAVLENIRPSVEVKSRRVGGSTYQVPVEVNGIRGTTLAMRWLVEAASGRSEKSMMRKLAAEIVDAYHNRGTAVKKRDDTHRMAKANQAFAHYRW
ncbi:MAG: 30S ribosomal protein S7 [Gammaproteobacteria bacterium RIFCSPHIGHO2_12_FULL_35_23]|nr:MAG: 30S ribosomal protein S7 [Gammaproteobacteria bacterium RIFCSPHIGHO2_12_FULL_35_23]